MMITVVLLACALGVAQANKAGKSVPDALDNRQITNGPVAEYVADSYATLGWSVRESSGSMSIKYGTDRNHMTQTADATPSSDGKNYHVRLQGLMPETQYYFQVVQKDEPVGGIGTFRTVASGATPIKSKATIPQ
jgi:hypothetical protein